MAGKPPEEGVRSSGSWLESQLSSAAGQAGQAGWHADQNGTKGVRFDPGAHPAAGHLRVAGKYLFWCLDFGVTMF